MKDIKIGDTVRMINSASNYYNDGDIAVITRIDKHGDYWGDFNVSQNDAVVGKGEWCFNPISCEIVEAKQ